MFEKHYDHKVQGKKMENFIDYKETFLLGLYRDNLVSNDKSLKLFFKENWDF